MKIQTPNSALNQSLAAILGRSCLFKGLLVPSLLFASQAAYADTVTWSLDDAGNWDDVANWSSGSIPSSSDDVYIGDSAASETLTLSGSSTAQGIVISNTSATTLNSGTLTLGADGITVDAGSGAVNLGAVIVLSASQEWVNNSSALLQANSTVTTGTGLGLITLTLNSSGSIYIRGSIQEGTGTQLCLVIDGGIYVRNDKSITSSYSGGTWIKNGTLAFYNGSYGTGTITMGDTASSSGTAVIAVNNQVTIANDIVVQGGGTSIIREADSSHNRTQTYTGHIYLNNTTPLQISGPSSGSGNIVFSGDVSGEGGILIQSSGGSVTFTLSGNNTFSGGVTLYNGTLDINSSTALGTGTFNIRGGTIDNTTGAALTLADTAQTWNNGFTFAGSNDLNLGAGVVTLGTASGSYRVVTVTANTLTVGGVISNGDTATGITKAGAGTLVLAGSNTYTGVTAINGGTLQLGNGSTGSLAGSSVSIAAGATFAVNMGDEGAYDGGISNNGAINAISSNTNIFNGVISGTGDFNQSGVGTTVINANNTYTGVTNVTGGELDVNGSISASSTVTVAGATLGGAGTVGGDVVVTSGTVAGNGLLISGSATFEGISSLSGRNTIGGVNVVSGTLSLTGSTASAVAVTSGATLKNNGEISGNVNVYGLLSGVGKITGSLVIESTGELSPGNSPGTTTIDGDLTVSTGALVSMQLDSLSSYDSIVVTGSVTLAGTLDLTLGNIQSGDVFTLIDNTGESLIATQFDSVTVSGSSVSWLDSDTFTYGNMTYELSYNGGTGNDVTLSVLAVPEPGTWAMLLSGIGCLIGVQRFRRHF